MHFLYNLGIWCYSLIIHLAAGFNPKAALWVSGRQHWRVRLRHQLAANDKPTLWMHVSSLGEFEQGRPVLELFRQAHPDWRIVLTFFSPSGFEVRKNYPHADVVAYLPADTPNNARDFLNLVKPNLAVFVKYDFWANYLFTLQKRQTPTLLIAALFRPEQSFFKWYGQFSRKILTCFDEIQVQEASSLKLLQSIDIKPVTVAGDTRIDRVLNLAAQAANNPVAQHFSGQSEGRPQPVLIAGSSWEADETLILSVLDLPEFAAFKLIIAPHDPSGQHLERLCARRTDLVLHSRYTFEPSAETRILVIDNVGMLNTLYQYADIAYIGGGFGKGIHNTLEPAAFGLPVIFGPKYQKFEEARQFVQREGAFPVENGQELVVVLHRLQDPAFYQSASKAVLLYLQENEGASLKAVSWLESSMNERPISDAGN